MKSALIIIVTVIILVLGIIVAATLFLGGRNQDGSGAGTVTLGRTASTEGVFVSMDIGETWLPRVRLSAKSGIGGVGVYDIAFRPDDPGSVFLGTAGNGLFISASSADEDADWVRITDASGILAPNTTVYQTAFDPRATAYSYVAVTQSEVGKVLRTADGAETFKEVYRTPKAKSGVYTIDFNVLMLRSFL